MVLWLGLQLSCEVVDLLKKDKKEEEVGQERDASNCQLVFFLQSNLLILIFILIHS